MKKVFILLGHEDMESRSRKMADEYERGAREAGHEVRRTNIGEMKFDPLLHNGYRVIQQLEPDLKKFEDDVKWAEHIVIVHPVWFSTVPAILKGLFDRIWLPSFAFHYFRNGLGWKKMLKGRSARVVMLQNSPNWASWVFFGDNSAFLKRAILGFSGIAPVRISRLTRTEKASENKMNRWKKQMHTLGKKAH